MAVKEKPLNVSPGNQQLFCLFLLRSLTKGPSHDLGLEKVLISDPTSTELSLGLTLLQLFHSNLVQVGGQPCC